MNENLTAVTVIQKRRPGRPRVAVVPANPQRARVAACMQRWCAETGMSLRQIAAGLNEIPGGSGVSFQALANWAAGRSIPLVERAKNGFLMSPVGTWQRCFWREMIAAVSPEDAILESFPA